MFALDMELTPEQRLFRELTRVLDHNRYAALAGVAQLGEVRVEEGVSTAYTNFKDIVFGKEFISTLTDEEIRVMYCPRAVSHRIHARSNLSLDARA